MGGSVNYLFNLTIASWNKVWERNQRNSAKLEVLYESVESLKNNYQNYLSLIRFRVVTRNDKALQNEYRLDFPNKPLMLIGLYLPELKSVEVRLLKLYGNLFELNDEVCGDYTEGFIYVDADKSAKDAYDTKVSDLRHEIFDTFETIFKEIKDLANSKGFTQPQEVSEISINLSNKAPLYNALLPALHSAFQAFKLSRSGF